MCLPQDTWQIRGDNVVYLTREPLPAEWERVRLHASRIRKLVTKFRDTRPNRPPKVHSGVLQPLFALFPPSSLFPNLSNWISQPCLIYESLLPSYSSQSSANFSRSCEHSSPLSYRRPSRCTS
ncbi:hypothetical protein M405DRAFT_824782 [Rhizopogon salebrosus TDB-379]|nr:hypothetical protein M405DRAFT_824782 [Rhizopogon salebrosus TDB-379]